MVLYRLLPTNFKRKTPSKWNRTYKFYASGCEVLPIPVAERMKATVCGRSLAGIAGSNLAGGMDLCLAIVVFFQVQICTPNKSPVQRSPTDCDVSLCLI